MKQKTETEVEVSMKLRVVENGFFMREHVGDGETGEGEKFEVSNGVGGGLIVEFKHPQNKDEWKCYIVSVQAVMDAVLALREKEKVKP